MSGPRPVHVEYSQRQQHFQTLAAAEQQRFVQIGNARLGVALLGAVLLYTSLVSHAVHPGWLGLPLGAFVLLMIWHEVTLRRQRRAERGRRIYDRGLDRLEDRWSASGSEGTKFRDAQHPYADDLDVFGAGSLFQLMSIARTSLGESTLAQWLKTPAAPTEIRARQEAVYELRPQVALREELALLGEDVHAGLHPDALIQWATAPPVPLPSWTRPAAFFFSAMTCAAVIATAKYNFPASVLLVAIAVQMTFAYSLRPRILQIIGNVDVPGRDLALLGAILGRLESEPFQSARLRQIQDRLKTAGQPPSHELGRLRILLELLDSRRNAFFSVFAGLLLWGTQFGLSLEQWRRGHGAVVEHWLEALGEMEALLSISSYAYEHSDDPFPVLSDDVEASAVFRATGLGHPLLPASACVRNDVALGAGGPRLLIISGSNMSGKSTLLRAIGLNGVLALMGAPVRAHSLDISPLIIGTSLRPQDSLQTGTSRFYAEITRLRDLVELSRRPQPLLFLLDELLSGTNSFDRQRGSEGVLHGLMATPAIGLLTTHDLALATLAETLPGTVNVHFEDQMIDGQLRFDYHLRAGVVQRSNAIELMRSIGLKV